jgi:hypothetical protein
MERVGLIKTVMLDQAQVGKCIFFVGNGREYKK